MADSTPLLIDKKNDQQPELVSIEEDMIEPYISRFNWPLTLQVVLVSMASFFEAQQTFITIFTDSKPKWHCIDDGNTSCNSHSNICLLPQTAWTWDKPPRTSTVSEWSLLCNHSPVILGLPTSAFFMGSLLGGIILSLIGDSIGRKNLLTLSCLIMSISSIFTAFAKNIWIYSALRTLTGFGRAAIGSCVLVLSTECVGKQWRGRIGILGFLSSTMGFLSLPAIAYLTKNYSWRSLYLLTAYPAMVYCLCIPFCVFESPRWLLQQGRQEESVAVISTFISPLDTNDLPKLLSDRNRKVRPFNTKSLVPSTDRRNQLLILLKNKSTLQRLLLAMVVGFGIGIIYYGMPLSLGNLDFNLYLSVAFNALLELPSSLMTLYMAKCKRRSTLLTLCITSGTFGILHILAEELRILQIELELVSFFTACVAYNLLLIYVVELFPMSSRNSALSAVWQAVVFGGAFSPAVIAAGGHFNRMLPDAVFGAVVFVIGPLVMLLPETIEAEQEQKNEAPYSV